MSNCPFCDLERAPNSGPNPGDSKRLSGLLRRAWRGIQWLFPTALLVLMPKCPMCVAAYVALFTGMGVSIPTARWIQILMLVFCVASLAYLVVRFCRARWHHRRIEGQGA